MSTHPIPTSFRLRRRKWTIKREETSRKKHVCGTASPAKKIVIYDRVTGRARSALEQQKTFWHEATHAVLFAMEHKLATDERFVTQFSLLLEELIRTARFDVE
jgi:hypothetical protein